MASQVSSDNERDSNNFYFLGAYSSCEVAQDDESRTVIAEIVAAWFYDRSGMPLDMQSCTCATLRAALGTGAILRDT